MESKITVIGAGIGGLALAISLQKKGIPTEIFEAAPQFGEVGAGINLAINAMQIFEKLGFAEAIYEAGHHIKVMNITDEQFSPLSQIPLTEFEQEFGVKSTAIHRATLHNILVSQLSNTPVHLNKKLRTIAKKDQGFQLTFEDGSTHKAAIVIGADGIHSVVRQQLFPPSELRQAKQICWRGVTAFPLSKAHQNQLTEAWGKGKRFGYGWIADGLVYWYALTDFKKDFRQEFANVDLEKLFEDFHPLVKKIIQATPKKQIITNEMLDLKPVKKWSLGRASLLGDAAHATTPNMGQGACQAIESAWALSHLLAAENSIEQAFIKYEKLRKKKAIQVVQNSWRIGKMAHWKAAIPIALRNTMMKMTPTGVIRKQNRDLYQI